MSLFAFPPFAKSVREFCWFPPSLLEADWAVRADSPQADVLRHCSGTFGALTWFKVSLKVCKNTWSALIHQTLASQHVQVDPSCVFYIPSLSVSLSHASCFCSAYSAEVCIAAVYCTHCSHHQWFPAFKGLWECVIDFFDFLFAIKFSEAFVLWSVSKVVVIGCSGFRACQPNFLDPLERRLGKPVVTSTQAFLWHMDSCLSWVGVKLSGYDPVLGC